MVADRADCSRLGPDPASSASRRLPERREELLQGDPKSRRQCAQRTDSDVALTAFNAADVVTMQVGPGREFLLGHAQFGPQFSNAASDCLGQVSRHTVSSGL